MLPSAVVAVHDADCIASRESASRALRDARDTRASSTLARLLGWARRRRVPANPWRPGVQLRKIRGRLSGRQLSGPAPGL